MVLTLALAAPARAEWTEDGFIPDVAPPDWHATIRSLATANRWRGLEAPVPLAGPMDLCSSPGCADHATLTLTEEEVATVRVLFAEPAPDSASERARIKAAVARLERLVGPRNGTDRDQPANDHDDWDTQGQLDCVAETVNTKTYLDRLDLAGWLTHHRVGPEVIRFTVILQHIAVSIVDADDESEWVVDSWPQANGAEPDILPWHQWRSGWAI